MAGDVSASSIKSLAAVGGLSPETQKGIDSWMDSYGITLP
jgi:hypothetical protein